MADHTNHPTDDLDLIPDDVGLSEQFDQVDQEDNPGIPDTPPAEAAGSGAGGSAAPESSKAPTPVDQLQLTPDAVAQRALLARLQDFSGAQLRTMSPEVIASEMVRAINISLAAESTKGGGSGIKFVPVTRLGFAELALLLSRLYRIVNIATSKNSDPDLDLLAIYDSDPSSDHYGTYHTSHDHLRRIARSYSSSLTTREFTEVLTALKDRAPRVTRGHDRDLIAVRNGVFNYATKQLLPFSPEHVFLAKSSVAYRPDANNVVIHNGQDGTDWDIESWMQELSDDPEIVELLWEIIGAIIRPYVSWNKSAWFYSEQGNNGKGTLVELMRNIVGENSYASIPLADFGKDFMLEPLTRASAILVDENDVGTFIDRAANLKAIVTNDVISINRKHRDPIAYQFYGFMVQCLNEFPKIQDRSESFYRRQLFIPFEKCFTGAERRYIKNDYLNRPEVLEYALKRVLHMNYYELSVPEATVRVLDEYKEYVDPVRAFWMEFENEFVWDLLPFPFLHELYKAWFTKVMPSSKPLGRNTFNKNLRTLATTRGWHCEDPQAATRPGIRMSAPEPLILEYDLQEWQDQSVKSPTSLDRAIPDVTNKVFRGLQRILDGDDDDLDDDSPAAAIAPTPTLPQD